MLSDSLFRRGLRMKRDHGGLFATIARRVKCGDYELESDAIFEGYIMDRRAFLKSVAGAGALATPGGLPTPAIGSDEALPGAGLPGAQKGRP